MNEHSMRCTTLSHGILKQHYFIYMYVLYIGLIAFVIDILDNNYVNDLLLCE